MRHRPEIDGLRAVAVVPIIALHAGFDRLGGGFVGVDIFFVISGYLITTILLDELGRGDFSIARFYERRAGASCRPCSWWSPPACLSPGPG